MQRDLSHTLARLSGSGFDLALDGAPGSAWVRLDRYAADPAIIDAGLRLAGSRFGESVPSAASGGWLVGDVAVAVAWPAVAALLMGDGLLVTQPSDIHLPHPSSGRRLAARIRPADPARAMAESATSATSTAAVQAFALGIATALEPLVEAVHRRTRRGRHALSCTITDMVAAAFHRVGDHLDVRDDARALASTIIDYADTLAGGANWHDIVWAGGTERTRIRNICCLWYRAPGGELCLTCPRVTDGDRRQMLERRAGAAGRG